MALIGVGQRSTTRSSTRCTLPSRLISLTAFHFILFCPRIVSFHSQCSSVTRGTILYYFTVSGIQSPAVLSCIISPSVVFSHQSYYTTACYETHMSFTVLCLDVHIVTSTIIDVPINIGSSKSLSELFKHFFSHYNTNGVLI